MTRETIIENCRRLLSFFKDSDKYTDHQIILDDGTQKEDISCRGLLRSYGRILDYYGSPSSFMSRLYLSCDCYNEFTEYVRSLENYQILEWAHTKPITFDLDGYHWIVEIK